MNEVPIRFDCEGEHLYGVVHTPERPSRRGVLIIVGGPQYRVGSHRQFVLLARELARAGTPAMRFDYRGMGDSEGEARTFEDIGADIRAATDRFLCEVPGLEEVVLWGLCDAASAAVGYAPSDPRIKGLVLLNPWVRTEAGIAAAYLQKYYRRRLLDASFWRKVRRGEVDVLASGRSLLRLIATSLGFGRSGMKAGEGAPTVRAEREPLPARMLAHLRAYSGRVLVILSGDDLTAEEFRRVTAGSRGWRRELTRERVTRRELAGANHTFSRRAWRDQVAAWTRDWVQSL